MRVCVDGESECGECGKRVCVVWLNQDVCVCCV